MHPESRSATPETDLCGALCPHGGHGCTLAATHGDNFTSSDPSAGPVHLCRQCNCTYDLRSSFHMHDGRQVDNGLSEAEFLAWLATVCIGGSEQ